MRHILSIISNVVLVLAALPGSSVVVVLVTSLDRSDFREFGVADHTIAIVVTSSEDGLDVFAPWEEAISLKVCNQVWHLNRVISFRDLFKYAHFNEILALCELILGLSAGTLQGHLFVEQAGEKRENFVRYWSLSSEIR